MTHGAKPDSLCNVVFYSSCVIILNAFIALLKSGLEYVYFSFLLLLCSANTLCVES